MSTSCKTQYALLLYGTWFLADQIITDVGLTESSNDLFFEIKRLNIRQCKVLEVNIMERGFWSTEFSAADFLVYSFNLDQYYSS